MSVWKRGGPELAKAAATVCYGDVRDVLAGLPHHHGGNHYMLDDTIFPVRERIIRSLDPQPRSVFEFGALVGYFLVTALHAAPSIERVGWIDNESHTPGSNELCFANVCSVPRGAKTIGNGRGEARWALSRDAVTWNGFELGYDLVQVDADHSYPECLADLHAADQLQARWIFVDDWTAEVHAEDVQLATFTFMAESRSGWGLVEYKTTNGLAVLTREG